MHLTLSLILSGALSALAVAQDPHVIWQQHLGDGSYLGEGISTAGDLNQDGLTDFMITFSSGVNINSGSDGSTLLTIDVKHAWMGSPSECCTLGDLNGDGLPEYAIAIPWLDRQWADNVGGIGLFSGADGSLLHYLFGTADEYMGDLLENAGDVNGDGYMDLLAGTHRAAATQGKAIVYSGYDGSILHTWYGTDHDDDYFGFDGAGVGDINNDAYGDIIIGAYRDDEKGTDAGMARVYSGRDGSVIYEFTGNNAGEFFGISVDGGMDADGDGRPDLLVRASYDGPSSAAPGAIYCYSGANGTLLWKAANSHHFSDTGFIGDINGDGYDDAAGSNPSDYTQLQILSGVDGSKLWELDGDWPLTHARKVEPLGDADGDGNDDFLITAIDSTDLGNSVFVYGGVANSHQLSLLVADPITAGTTALIWILNSNPGSNVQLYRGSGHGRTYINVYGTIDLQQALRIAQGNANPSGDTRFNLYVPPRYVGLPVWLQATNADGLMSNVVYRVVE